MVGSDQFRRCDIPKPTPVSPPKNPALTDIVVLPGADGINPGARAAVAARPFRASVRLVSTWACRPETCDCKAAAVLCNWPYVATSVGPTPGATFVIRRSLPGEPSETTLAWFAT